MARRKPKLLIHVNQHKIRSNIKADEADREPIFTLKQGRSNIYAHGVTLIHGGAVVGTLVYKPDNPLSCGARVWLEVGDDVDVQII
jgi:hypothetical protein